MTTKHSWIGVQSILQVLEALPNGGGHVADGGMVSDVERGPPLWHEFRRYPLLSLVLYLLDTIYLL